MNTGGRRESVRLRSERGGKGRSDDRRAGRLGSPNTPIVSLKDREGE